MWRHPMTLRSLQAAALLIAASCICAPRAGAQDPSAGTPATTAGAPSGIPSWGTRGFFELGQTQFGTENGMQAGLRFSPVTPNRPALDFALAFWFASEPVMTSDLDIAFPIDLGGGTRLVPRAGGSGILTVGGPFGYMALGTNAGVGLIVQPGGPLGLRLDYTARKFAGEELANDVMHTVTAGLSWRAKSAYPSITSAPKPKYPDPSIASYRSEPRAPVDPNSAKRMYLQFGRLWVPEGEESIATGELRFGSVTPLKPSADFALSFGLVPALIANADLDLAIPVALAPGVRVIPRTGISM